MCMCSAAKVLSREADRLAREARASLKQAPKLPYQVPGTSMAGAASHHACPPPCSRRRAAQRGARHAGGLRIGQALPVVRMPQEPGPVSRPSFDVQANVLACMGKWAMWVGGKRGWWFPACAGPGVRAAVGRRRGAGQLERRAAGAATPPLGSLPSNHCTVCVTPGQAVGTEICEG